MTNEERNELMQIVQELSYEANSKLGDFPAGDITATTDYHEFFTTASFSSYNGHVYRVDLDINWETGRRQRDLHFSTIRSVLARPQ